VSLSKKQRITNEQFAKIHKNAHKTVSKALLDKKVDETVENIKKQVKGKKIAISWSGGKDSIVLEHICRIVGNYPSFIVHNDLEYPQFMRWVDVQKPEGLEYVNTGQDLAWLARNKHMLFPKTSTASSQWFRIVQHKGQDKYFKDNELDLIVLGRRRADGNYFPNNEAQYTNKKSGTVRFCPLKDWSHEYLFAFLVYYHCALPPIYQWPRGYTVGTGPWAKRKVSSDQQGWSEIFKIDPQIVKDAAHYFDSASDFLESRGVRF